MMIRLWKHLPITTFNNGIRIILASVRDQPLAASDDQRSDWDEHFYTYGEVKIMMECSLPHSERKPLRATKTLLCLLLLTASASVYAKEDWTSIRSRNFVVVGNANERSMRNVAFQLEQFRYVVSLLFPRVKIETAVPTNVILFKNHNSF